MRSPVPSSWIQRHRSENHLIIDSHQVTLEAYGFRIAPFSPARLDCLFIDEFWLLVLDNPRAIERIRRDPKGRRTPTSFQAGLHTYLQASLALQYAESHSEHAWTESAYDRVLSEVQRLLNPRGTFVFSVNVPEPAWGKVALYSLGGVFRTSRPARYLKQALRMLSYGNWLKREARRGRFHYLPREVILAKLRAVGFTNLEHRLSYAGQAYLFRCRRDA